MSLTETELAAIYERARVAEDGADLGADALALVAEVRRLRAALQSIKDHADRYTRVRSDELADMVIEALK